MNDPVAGAVAPLLYLTHRVPYPPDKGDRIRTYHTLRHLAQRGPVDLACLADEPPAPGAVQALRGLCRRVEVIDHHGWKRWARALGWLASGCSISEGVFWSPRLAGLVRAWAGEMAYAAVLTSASSLGPYLDLPGVRHLPAIVDLMDVDSQKWRDYARRASGPRRLVYTVEAGRVERLERRLARRAQALLVVSEAEARLFRDFCLDAPVAVVPNGVDLDYFSPAEGTGQGCVFVGALDYWPNVDAAMWFCRDIWPEVRRRCPAARVRLVGRRPVPEVVRLQEIDGVDVVGQVPDVRPHVAEAAVAIAPLRIARGVQNKVLEGMAMARPVLASPQALQGLGGHDDLPVLTATTVDDWVEHLAGLFAQPARCRELGERGRAYVERHHGWGPCLSSLDRLLDAVAPAACGRD